MTAQPHQSLSDELDSLETALIRIRKLVADKRTASVDRLVHEVRNADRPEISTGELVAKARAIYYGRRNRDKIFEGLNLFSDPAWDMLLDLFIAKAERLNISVSSAVIASCTAPTTGLRWISQLERDGLVCRRADPFDRRRSYLDLTDRAYVLVADAISRS